MKNTRVVILTEDVKKNDIELKKGTRLLLEGQIQKVNSGEQFHIVRDQENRVMFIHENTCIVSEMEEADYQSLRAPVS